MESCSFHVADATCMSIEPPHFENAGADGSRSVLPWTLQNYLKMSNIHGPASTLGKALFQVVLQVHFHLLRPQVTAESSSHEDSFSDACSERMSAGM